MKTPKTKRNRTAPSRSVQRLVSRHRVTFYINPDDPDGTKLVLPGLVDDTSMEIAADHFGCDKDKIVTRSRMVTDKFLNELPEYDG